MIVDVPVIMLFVFQQSKSYVYCAAIQFLDRVPDIPVVPQKGDSTVQSLSKVVDAGCARQLPMVQTVLLRSPTKSSTSLFSWCLRFSHRQSSMTISRRNGCFFGTFCVIFRAAFSSPRRRRVLRRRGLPEATCKLVLGLIALRMSCGHHTVIKQRPQHPLQPQQL